MIMNRTIFSGVICLVILAACVSKNNDTAVSEYNVPLLNETQKQLADIKTGRLEVRHISSLISCTGEIEVPPQGMASVTAPLGGYIVKTSMVPGIYVKKGDVLATLSNPEYIMLQQSYMETAGQLKFAQQDYDRQKMLQAQDATAARKFQESESSFTVLKARLSGLQEQLRMIGIGGKELESGKINGQVFLRSPIAGYVTAVNHHPGQFVEPREVIFEIIDTRDLHLHLNVFEQDISRIRKGQSVRFRPSGDKTTTYRGEVLLVSPRRQENVATFDVHGHIEEEDEKLKPGMYVEAEIFLSDDSVYALPQVALVQSADRSFVVTEENGEYTAENVDIGAKMDGWVEIRNNERLRSKKIVTEGATRIFTALQKK
jgi:membrane fusion protein, heavy metal efflux system